jgi:type I restriction enzyme R subunit
MKMPSQTNEAALEATIEKQLTGTCLEDLISQGVALNNIEERVPLYRSGNGYYIGLPEDFNAKYAIDEMRFWDFLQSTQKEELAKLQKQSDWKLKILERLDRMIKKYGILRLFRKGLDVDDAHFTLLYPLPLASSSEKVKTNFESNQFSATRQLRYSLTNTGEEIDMVLFVNGLPFATMELKNHWTGQNAKVHGQNQYKFKRDITQPLLNFGRCIVHFAVDTDEVYMTTKVEWCKYVTFCRLI